MYKQEECKFLSSHEWVFVEGDIATTGISDHAQHEISDIVFVDAPKVGQQVTAGKQACVIESVKSASDVFAPVSGEVIEVNPMLKGDPAIVNKAPHAEGWLYKIKMSNPKEVEALLSFDGYKATL